MFKHLKKGTKDIKVTEGTEGTKGTEGIKRTEGTKGQGDRQDICRRPRGWGDQVDKPKKLVTGQG